MSRAKQKKVTPVEVSRDAEREARLRKKEEICDRHAIWEVTYGGPDGLTQVGLFASREDALVVYRATRLTRWLDHATTRAFGMGQEPDAIRDEEGGHRGGLYCVIGELYSVSLHPVMVVPATLPVAESLR